MVMGLYTNIRNLRLFRPREMHIVRTQVGIRLDDVIVEGSIDGDKLVKEDIRRQ